MNELRRNWAGNIRYASARVHHPESIEQVQEIVARSRKVKVFGARHSFNAITDTTEEQICLDKMDQSLSIDQTGQSVTVSGGITYGQLCTQLDKAGRALHNMASLPHISVAGAVATATHGSGDGNGNLATAVTALELVRADGEIVTLSRQKDGETFLGAVVNLGALGVVTRMALETQPAFVMQQEVYERLPLAQAEAHFDAIFSSAYSVSFFTDWQEESINQVWLKRHLADGSGLTPAPTFYGGALATRHLHPLKRLSADPCTPQMGIPGPWQTRLPHFLIDHAPASGDELQAEYFVDRKYAVAALAAVARLRRELGPVLILSEIRSVAADSLWMSTAYEQATIGIHFSLNNDWPSVRGLLPLIEKQLAPFQPRPHWGKLFTMPGEQIQARYPKLHEFRALAQAFDPQGKFRNDYLDATIFA
ncbi:MAG: FAD-binding protein [Chloroflexi bacterium]|nr:MAG: FAD-binding protein [Chloroflexota bacterium]